MNCNDYFDNVQRITDKTLKNWLNQGIGIEIIINLKLNVIW